MSVIGLLCADVPSWSSSRAGSITVQFSAVLTTCQSDPIRNGSEAIFFISVQTVADLRELPLSLSSISLDLQRSARVRGQRQQHSGSFTRPGSRALSGGRIDGGGFDSDG